MIYGQVFGSSTVGTFVIKLLKKPLPEGARLLTASVLAHLFQTNQFPARGPSSRSNTILP